jgi:hypothetical protein
VIDDRSRDACHPPRWQLSNGYRLQQTKGARFSGLACLHHPATAAPEQQVSEFRPAALNDQRHQTGEQTLRLYFARYRTSCVDDAEEVQRIEFLFFCKSVRHLGRIRKGLGQQLGVLPFERPHLGQRSPAEIRVIAGAEPSSGRNQVSHAQAESRCKLVGDTPLLERRILIQKSDGAEKALLRFIDSAIKAGQLCAHGL